MTDVRLAASERGRFESEGPYPCAYGTAGTYGVVTAYCEGIAGACPDYVQSTVNQ